MKTFRLYDHPFRNAELVKNGWAWPAFFFTWIWALFNAAFIYTIILFLCWLLIIVPWNAAENSFLRIVLYFLFGWGSSIWAGLKGNDWRAKRLVDRGYIFVRNIEARGYKSANRQMLPEILFDKGVELYESERFQEAEKKLRQALYLAPKSEDIMYNLALVYLHQEKYGKVSNLIQKIENLDCHEIIEEMQKKGVS
jgi:tetratricopeptide (TPR) repeat protein